MKSFRTGGDAPGIGEWLRKMICFLLLVYGELVCIFFPGASCSRGEIVKIGDAEIKGSESEGMWEEEGKRDYMEEKEKMEKAQYRKMDK